MLKAIFADMIILNREKPFIILKSSRNICTNRYCSNMMGFAAGLATAGKIPFRTFANFATSRVLDQVRQSIAYSKKCENCCFHAGLTLGRGYNSPSFKEHRSK